LVAAQQPASRANWGSGGREVRVQFHGPPSLSKPALHSLAKFCVLGNAASRPHFVLFNAALVPMQPSKHENYAYTHMRATKHTLYDNQNHIK